MWPFFRRFFTKSSGYWVYVCKNDNFIKYYKPSSVEINNKTKIIKVLVKDIFTKKGKIEFLNDHNSIEKQLYIDIHHITMYVLLDYKEWHCGITQVTYYSKSDNVLFNQTYALEWFNIKNDSDSIALYKKLFKRYNKEMLY